MTHDEMIAVIQAHKDGKVVQYKSRMSEKGWVTPACRANIFPHNFDSYDYRIKPEPRVRYIPVWNKDEDTLYEVAYKTAGDLLRTCDRSELHHYIKMVEVIE